VVRSPMQPRNQRVLAFLPVLKIDDLVCDAVASVGAPV